MEEQTLEELLEALSLPPAMIMMLPSMNMVRNLSPFFSSTLSLQLKALIHEQDSFLTCDSYI